MDQFDQDIIVYQANQSQYSRSIKDESNKLSLTNSFTVNKNTRNGLSKSFAEPEIQKIRFNEGNYQKHTQVSY